MDELQKQQIIESAKEYFRSKIIVNHRRNVEKLSLASFDINPFSINYLAVFLCGNTEPESLAKALVYPRVLGTSFNTTFGTQLQKFIATLKQVAGKGSVSPGFDLEFTDAIDGKTKYCQCKAGPNTINKDDVPTILKHFRDFRTLAKTNGLSIDRCDVVLGVLYGERPLTTFYSAVEEAEYSVYYGKEFWEHLTGDKDFYYRLAKAFGEVADEPAFNGCSLINEKIKQVADEIRMKINKDGGL